MSSRAYTRVRACHPTSLLQIKFHLSRTWTPPPPKNFRFIVDPTHDWKTAWDAYIGVWTIFSIFLIPLQMAFIPEIFPKGWDFLFYFSDITFLVNTVALAVPSSWLLSSRPCFVQTDILVNFRTAFLNDAGVYDTTFVAISQRYAKS